LAEGDLPLAAHPDKQCGGEKEEDDDCRRREREKSNGERREGRRKTVRGVLDQTIMEGKRE
jgi:hypothetical protein